MSENLEGIDGVLLEDVRHFFGLGEDKLKEAANRQQLPIPTFRLRESQKSPWMVHKEDLARLIEDKAEDARKEHHDVNGA